MNITLTSLEALILKATNESLPCPEAAALEAFCAVMRDSAEGPQLAAQALAVRIHSSNAREALLALSMLDRCMRRGDTNFQAEVGKFRFLNEMIKLVSPKYCAYSTAPEVKTRVLQLFHAWSIEYPKEFKFKVAYDMLKNQGVIQETPPPLPPEEVAPQPRAKNAIFEDEEKSKLLQKLLQSKKPEDLQHANRLIKTMVKEEERLREALGRRAAETGAALDSGGLLREMLAHAHAARASADELQLIRELHASCRRLRPALQRLAADTQGDSLEDILHASDVLDEACMAYDAFVGQNKDTTNILGTTTPPSTNGDSLVDIAPGGRGARGGGGGGGANTMDELGDIFAAAAIDHAAIAQPLKPVNLMSQDDADLLGERRGEEGGERAERGEGWLELDSLGEQLLRQALPDRARRPPPFASKSSKKIPMNALEKTSPTEEGRTSNDALLDLDFFTKGPGGGSPGRALAKGPGGDAARGSPGRALTKGPGGDAARSSPGRAGGEPPQQPRRPRPAHLMWLDSVRDQIRAEHPDFTMGQVASLGGEKWRALGASEKSPWEEQAAIAKEKYSRDVETYTRKRAAGALVIVDDLNEGLSPTLRQPPTSAYTMWRVGAAREIHTNNPELTMDEIDQKCGLMWLAMGASDRNFWEQKYASSQEQAQRDLQGFLRPAAPPPPPPPPAAGDAPGGSPTDTMLDISMPGDGSPPAADATQLNAESNGWSEARSLDDIQVSVSRVTPSGAPPLAVLPGGAGGAGGVAVALHACRERPRPGVSVLVLSTTNCRASRIDDYKLSAVVPKPPLGCRVRLLPASGSTLPPHNAFASEAITQVMLVSRPSPQAAVPLKVAVTYVCDDDMHSAMVDLQLPADALP